MTGDQYRRIRRVVAPDAACCEGVAFGDSEHVPRADATADGSGDGTLDAMTSRTPVEQCTGCWRCAPGRFPRPKRRRNEKPYRCVKDRMYYADRSGFIPPENETP